MEILVKVGNKKIPTDQRFDNERQDGRIIMMRQDGQFPAQCEERRHGYAVISTPDNFFDLCDISDYKGLKKIPSKALGLLPYFNFSRNGKYQWESGYVDGKIGRKGDYFLDWDRLLQKKIISQSQFDSLYDFNNYHIPIHIDEDFTKYIAHEDGPTKRIKDIKLKPKINWDAGNVNVASSGGDYTLWSTALDALGDLTGDASITGTSSEEISETVICLIDIETGGYTLTLKAASGVKHNGGAYGSGHRIAFDSFDGFKVDEVTADTTKNVIIQDLAIDASGTTNRGIWLADCGVGGDIIAQRNVIKGDSNAYVGVQADYYAYNTIIRNNAIYGFTYSLTTSRGYGILLNNEYGTCERHIYNNTCCKNSAGIGERSSTPVGAVTVKNNLCYGNTDYDFIDSNSAFTTAKNVSGDTTSPDGTSYRSWAGTANMVDYTNNDFRLDLTDSTLDDGDDLSAIGTTEQFSDDIEDNSRSTWFIGASEFISSGSLLPIFMNHHLQQMGAY